MKNEVGDERVGRGGQVGVGRLEVVFVCDAAGKNGFVPPFDGRRRLSLQNGQVSSRLSTPKKKKQTLRLRSRVSNSLSRPAFLLASAILCLRASIFCSFRSCSPCSTYLPALLNWSFLDLRAGALSSSGAGELAADPAAYGLSTGAGATAGEAREGVWDAATLALALTEVNLGAIVL